MSGRRALTIVTGASLAVAALFVAYTFAGDTGPYRSVLTYPTLVRAAAVCKLAALAFACLHSILTFRRLDRANDARLPWLLLALALGGFTLGQAILSGHQLVYAKSPFPSPADALFIAAYPLLLASFVQFGRTYRRSGLPVGPVRQHVAIAASVLVAGALVAGPLLRPILKVPGTPLEHALNVAYPALDLVVLAPLAILVRIAWPFRGGAIFRAWALLLAGTVGMCAGDLFFAWFSMMDASHLDPLVHGSYLVAYACLAWGTRLHRDLLD